MKQLQNTRYFASGLAIIFLSLPGSNSWGAAGTQGASFLEVPVGARPASLGSAYSAMATDVYAPVWNPAGLGWVEHPELTGMHLSYLQDVRYEFAGGVLPLWKGSAVGGAIQIFRPGVLEGRDAAAAPLGDIGGSFQAYSLAFGQKIGDHFSLGLTGKSIRARIDDVKATSFAVDGGAMVRLSQKLSTAFVVSNLGKKLTFLQEGDDLPRAYRLGAAYQPISWLNLSMEGVHRQTGLNSFHAGLELSAEDILSLRFGYNSEKTKELSALAAFSLGVGINVWGQEIDYAWVPIGELGQSHYFSLVFRWGVEHKKYGSDEDASLEYDPEIRDAQMKHELMPSAPQAEPEMTPTIKPDDSKTSPTQITPEDSNTSQTLTPPDWDNQGTPLLNELEQEEKNHRD